MDRTHWAVSLLLVLLAGCAIGYTKVNKAPDTPLKGYRILEVPDLAGSDQVPEETKRGIAERVAEEIGKEKLFNTVERRSGQKESVLLLNGRVLQYSPGSRGMRYLTGPLWGVGKGSVIVNVKFIDKATGKELADSNFEGEIKGGIFGGGIDETHSKIAEEIVQFIKSNY